MAKISAKLRNLLIEHATAAKNLAEWKAKEMELRTKVAEAFFPGGVKKGVNAYEIDDGFVLKITGSENIKVDEAKIPEIMKKVKTEFKLTPEIWKTKVELKVGNYNALPAEVKEVINDCLTISAGSPSIEIVKPKK